MKNDTSARPLIKNIQQLKAYFLLGLLGWISHFLYFRGFGLYEDDYSLISPAFGWNLSQLIAKIGENFSRMPQGRPLGFSLPPIISFIGYNLGKLTGLYILIYLIFFLNVILVYHLVKRISSSESLARLAGMAFIIFPADTTRSFLMHGAGLQPSLTFLLLASLAYLSDKKSLSYIIILGSLLTYETPYLVFAGIPLLKLNWGRKLGKELFRHVVILSFILLGVFGVRYFFNETRVHELGGDIFLVPLKIVASFIIGPVASFGLFLYAPIMTLVQLDFKILMAILFSFIAIGWFLMRPITHASHRLINDGEVTGVWLTGFFKKLKILPENWRLAQLTLASTALLCLAYGFSFTHFPPINYHGRLTSVHLAASIGGSILLACLATGAIAMADKYKYKIAASAVLSVYLAISVGYGVFVQKDFLQSWREQKCFWSETLPLAQDMEDGTIIFFPFDETSNPEYIETHSWADPIMLRQIYEFPKNWQNPPRLFAVDPSWSDSISINGSQFEWVVPKATWPVHTEILPASNMILLSMNGKSLIRKDGNILIQDREFSLRPISGSSARLPFPKGVLYDLLIGEEYSCTL